MIKVLILASVASMIDQFNMPNIILLQQLGYDVHVAANFKYGNTSSKQRIDNFKKELKELNVTFYHVEFSRKGSSIINNIRAFKQINILMKKNRYKFVHCHSPIGGLCGRIIGHMTKTTVIYTAHGFHFYKGAPLINWLIYYPAEKWLARNTDVLITINKEDYCRAKNFKAKKIKYLPGVGVDIDKFKNIEFDKEKKRKSIGINIDDFMIISVGELNKNKNHQAIIKAVAKLKNEKIKYIVCGQGPLENELRGLTNALRIDNQVKFLGFRKDIVELMNVADLFAFPSYREGLSLSLMEAMASGLPVVCSKIRGNIELIEEGKGGYLIDPKKPLEFADKINKLYKDRKLRNSFAGNNYNHINNFSIKNVIDKISQIYKEL
jgi:glycosyltransferase involved in cell wall biosynthesis